MKMINLILCLFLVSCETIESEPIASTTTNGDFEVTITSIKDVYDKNDQIGINVTFKYTGTEDEITIWSSSAYHSISIIDNNKEYIYIEGLLDVPTEFRLKPNNDYQFEPCREINLSKGEYTAEVYIDFFLDDDRLEFSAEVPIVVK